MERYTITKKDAQKIFIGRLIVIVPSALIGLFLGLFGSYNEVGSDLMFKVIVPITVLVTAGSLYLGMRLGMNKIINTVFLIDDETITEETNKGIIKTIIIKKIITVKENIFGLAINDSKNKITIPKQLEFYSKLKNEIKRQK